MTTFGSNLGYVNELYARYLEDPESVSEAWREFFADYPVGQPQPTTAAPMPAIDGAEPIRGIAARIVENMTASLSIPTATSVRTIPVKLLDENRRLLNRHQAAVNGAKISFTHLIAWAIVRAIEKHPAMNGLYCEVEDAPHRLPRAAINLGLAIDVERREERILLVPNLKDAGKFDFPSFVAAYDALVARARQGKLAVEDFKDTTVTLTNPGTIGTSLSVPRLMQGQSLIVGTGVVGYPPEFAGVSPEVISDLGISKVMTVTSTYDHRVIQGAESGAFLAHIEKLLLGEESFYQRIFNELGVPHEPIAWSGDRNPTIFSAAGDNEAIEKQARVIQLIRAYRVRGHLWADRDPLGYAPQPHPELELSHYGLTMWDLDRKFMAGGIAGKSGMLPLREIVETLRETYCRQVGVEYMHIPEPEIRAWLQEKMEGPRNAEPLASEMQNRILLRLNAAEAFERFLHTAYTGHKRFSLEGAETLVPMLDELLNDAAATGIEEVVIGMAHRGRLNVLTNTVGKSYGSIFREFEGDLDPESMHGSGDVKYHLGATGVHTAPDGKKVSMTLASNPSHLEAVDPVVEGMARARQDWLGDTSRSRVLPVLIHGDAAFAGQGVVAETLNLSQLRGYRTGGTVHIVVNNQIGFTTGPADARSSFYPTDVAKMVRAPIFHVNGDHPEAAVRVIRLALAFRQAFKRDVVVDLVCYRRWGHNEGDEPSFTHPLLYAKIEKHRSVRKLYTEHLLRRGDIDLDTAEKALNDYRERLQGAFDEVQQARDGAADDGPQPAIETMADEAPLPPVDTAVAAGRLEEVFDGLERTPEGFTVHPKLAKQLAQRRERVKRDRIDWALAEAMAFGSLVLEGTPIRLSGQDSGRGTFSQRHAILYDYRTGAPYTPLAHLKDVQAPFQVVDSLLSEFAVLGFEYGYSVDYTNALVMWEAQFGDFVNGAQIITDQFITSAEDKWAQKSALVMLLPHGYEGQGPEHSSARLGRFLGLCARNNIRVAYPSTPAQYFHLLRRQASSFLERKPLIVMTPKSLLRNPEAVSPLAAFTGGTFTEVLVDPGAGAPEKARRVVLAAGKIFYELDARRRELGIDSLVILRMEQFYPFPGERIEALLARHAHVRDVAWVQEEPRNMGAWSFMSEHLRFCLAPGQTLRYVGRPRSPSPATGSQRRHQLEQREILDEALAGLAEGQESGRTMEAAAKN